MSSTDKPVTVKSVSSSTEKLRSAYEMMGASLTALTRTLTDFAAESETPSVMM